jgi:molybdate transport system permease protein
MSVRVLQIQRALLATLAAFLAAFLALPLLVLVTSTTYDDFVQGLAHPLVWPALRLSLLTTSFSLLLVVALGTPLAWCLAQGRRRGFHLLEVWLQLPIVVPPAVAGVALLMAFGRRGVLADYVYATGWSVAFSTAAVVLAQVFVSAPFFIQAATSAFRRVDPELLIVARTLGAKPLRVVLRVALPLAAPGLVAGAALCWARALGEFGATLMFAGNLQGKTQTLPLAIYTVLESDLRAAQALSIVLVVAALGVLVLVRASQRDARPKAEAVQPWPV